MEDPQSNENLDRQILSLESRSLVLSRAASVILVLLSAAGLGALLVPDLTPGVGLRIAGERTWYTLVVLLGLGLVLGLAAMRQARVWAAARRGLLGEVVRRDVLEKLMLIDPLTGTFNRATSMRSSREK